MEATLIWGFMTELEAGIVGHDRDALVAFYTDVLGFTLTQELAFDTIGLVLKLRRDGARLKLFFPVGDVDAPTAVEPWFRPGGWRYAALYLGARPDLEGIIAATESGGGRVVLAPTAHRVDAVTALIADPEGNHWELLWEGAR